LAVAKVAKTDLEGESGGCGVLIERASQRCEVHVAIDAAELFAGFGHAGGAPNAARSGRPASS
jgi:hypothetical protein